MQTGFLAPFEYGGCIFDGGWLFEETGVRARFVLGKNGCGMLMDETLCAKMRRGAPDEALCVKLLQHALVRLKDAPHWSDGTREWDVPVRPDYFVLDLTRACNFDCAYCFRDLSDRRVISQQVLRDACAFIDQTARRLKLGGVRIQLWGGEPLTAMERIDEVTSYFQNKPYAVGFDLETNASLAAERIARLLFSRRVRVGVSLDGAPEQQDAQRVFVGGAPTSAAVEKGVRALQSAYGRDLGGICVVTKNNSNALEQMEAYWQRLNLGGIKCNLVRDNPNAPQSGLALDEEQTRDFARRLFCLWEASALAGRGFDEGNIRTRWENLTRRADNNCCLCRGCTAGRRIVSIDMNGGIFPCEMMDYPDQRLGSIYDPEPLEEQLARGARKRARRARGGAVHPARRSLR